MSPVSVPTAEVLLSKRVQEMVKSGQEPLGPYVCRNDGDYTVVDSTHNNSPIPLINIAHFLSGKLSTKEGEQELVKLKSALSTWGCFQAVGHGISTSSLEEIQLVGRGFFEQPMEEKNKIAKKVTEFQGYGADPLPEEGQSLDWSDRLVLAIFPEDQRDYKFWPQNPTSFKKTLEDYSDKMKELAEIISKSMATSLGLEENCFLKQFGEQSQLHSKFNYYSPCTRPDLVLGLKAHTDGSGYTLIVQDGPGVQILKDGKWYPVPTNPDAVLVLMADQMEIMSNGIFKAPVHRVITDAKKDRISVAMFYTPEVGKEIGPEEGLISAEVPRRFKKVKDYTNIYLQYYNKGLRGLPAVQYEG